jgi:hypothetical protein
MTSQQHLQPDVISLQYMELEEFLLENASSATSAVVVGHHHQDRDSKVYIEHCGNSNSSCGSNTNAVVLGEKQYQVSLEQRGYDLASSAAAVAAAANNSHLLHPTANSMQQHHLLLMSSSSAAEEEER